MRYPQNRKAETRQKLIEKSGALAKKEGFATTGVDGLMASVGLTGGAFYSHFESKNELLLEIIKRELETSNKLLSQQLSNGNTEGFLNIYLSTLHVNLPEMGCAMPTLASEVARSDAAVKEAFEQGLVKTHATLEAQLGNTQQAWAVLAMTVGAVSLARAMKNPATQETLLTACKEFLLSTKNNS